MRRQTIDIDEFYFHIASKPMYYILGAIYGGGRLVEKSYIKQDDSKSIYKGIVFSCHHKDLVQLVIDELQVDTVIISDNREEKEHHWFEKRGVPILYGKLEKLGLGADDIIFPEIPEIYLSHFVRGFSDARAVISLYNNNTTVRFRYAESFLVGLEKVLRKYASAEPSESKDGYRAYTHKNSQRIHGFIYEEWPYIETRKLYVAAKEQLFKPNYVFDWRAQKIRAERELRIREARVLFAKGFRPTQVATRLGLSKSTLSVDFKKVYGMTPSEYIDAYIEPVYSNLKQKDRDIIDKAKQLLLKMKCGEVAETLEMSSSDFSRLFLEITGMNPLKYKTLMLEEIAEMGGRPVGKLGGPRLEEAKWLLKNENVVPVSKRMEFSTCSNFCLQFKKLTGETPNQYKKSLKN